MESFKNILHPNKAHHETLAQETGSSAAPMSTGSTAPHHANHETMATAGNERNMTSGVHEPTTANRHFGQHNTNQEQLQNDDHFRDHNKHHLGRDAAVAGVGYEAVKHHKHKRDGSHATSEGMGSTRSSAEFGAGDTRIAAEEGNNFPGTNPHPAHTALGTMSGRSLAFPGQE